MSAASIRSSKVAWVLLILAIAISLWIPRQIKLADTRRWIRDAQSELDVLRGRLDTATETFQSAQRECREANDSYDQALTAVANADRSLTTKDPEARWVAPPASLPEWNDASPYVWLRKEMVPRLPVSPFGEDGELRPELGQVLVIDPAAQRDLNTQLKQLLADYRALEAASAERTEGHPPGIAGEPGEKLTIRVRPLPEDGARIKRQFEAALVNALGDQRAGLLIKTAEQWLNSEFAQSSTEPETISVVRSANGNFGLTIEANGNWMSTSGSAEQMKSRIPPHLRPMFRELFDRPAPSDAAKQGP